MTQQPINYHHMYDREKTMHMFKNNILLTFYLCYQLHFFWTTLQIYFVNVPEKERIISYKSVGFHIFPLLCLLSSITFNLFQKEKRTRGVEQNQLRISLCHGLCHSENVVLTIISAPIWPNLGGNGIATCHIYTLLSNICQLSFSSLLWLLKVKVICCTSRRPCPPPL